MNTRKSQIGSSFPETMVFLALFVLVAYFLMAWAMGTTNVSAWPALMAQSANPIVKLVYEILYRIGFFGSVTAIMLYPVCKMCGHASNCVIVCSNCGDYMPLETECKYTEHKEESFLGNDRGENTLPISADIGFALIRANGSIHEFMPEWSVSYAQNNGYPDYKPYGEYKKLPNNWKVIRAVHIPFEPGFAGYKDSIHAIV